MWVVPIVFGVCSLLAIDYPALGDKTIGDVVALFIASQVVGWGEEGMFRGIGVTTLRGAICCQRDSPFARRTSG